MMAQKVVIVGAGLIGAFCAWRLAQRGADVTVVEAGVPGGVASAASFGWINASFFLDNHHYTLRREAMTAWHRAETELGPLVDWCGALNWEAEDFEAAGASLRARGYELEAWEGARLRAAVPGLADGPERAWFASGEGVVEAAEVARRLLAGAGVRVLSGCKVERIEARGDRVRGVRLEGGVIAADRVLVAAGNGAPGLLAPLGLHLEMLRRPAVVLRTAPVETRIAPVLVTPQMEIRQDAAGCLIAPASPNHQGDERAALEGTAQEMAQETLARLRAMFPGLALEMAEARLAWRPVPGDGLPVVGAVGPEGLWLAVMHSGVTLGALIGELVADEMAGGDAALLAPYRLGRFG